MNKKRLIFACFSLALAVLVYSVWLMPLPVIHSISLPQTKSIINAKMCFAHMELIMRPFPTLPQEAMVYKTYLPEMSGRTVQQIASGNFDMKESEIKSIKSNTQHMITGEKYNLLVDDDGVIYYYQPSERLNINKLGNRSREGYPSDEQCERIAWKFLEDHGLMPEGEVFLSKIIDNTSSYVMTVRLGRKLNGIEIIPPGERIYIDIMKDGTIRSVFIDWSIIKPFKTYPLKSPDAAIKTLETGDGIVRGAQMQPLVNMNRDGSIDFFNIAKGELISTDIVYFPSYGKVNYVQPFYRFTIKVKNGNLYAYTNAISDNYLIKSGDEKSPKETQD